MSLCGTVLLSPHYQQIFTLISPFHEKCCVSFVILSDSVGDLQSLNYLIFLKRIMNSQYRPLETSYFLPIGVQFLYLEDSRALGGNL